MREKDDCALKADDGREKRTKKTRIAKKEPQDRKGETTFIIRSLSRSVSGSVFLSRILFLFLCVLVLLISVILFLCGHASLIDVEKLKKEKGSRCLESFFSATTGNGIMKSNGNNDKYNNSGARGVLANIR